MTAVQGLASIEAKLIERVKQVGEQKNKTRKAASFVLA
jgi:hypothetical protein